MPVACLRAPCCLKRLLLTQLRSIEGCGGTAAQTLIVRLHPRNCYDHVVWPEQGDSSQWLLQSAAAGCPALQMLHVEGAYYSNGDGAPFRAA